jgi:hypothetical protein
MCQDMDDSHQYRGVTTYELDDPNVHTKPSVAYVWYVYDLGWERGIWVRDTLLNQSCLPSEDDFDVILGSS